MKNIYILFLAIVFISCEEAKYTHIGQEIIDGKVSKTSVDYPPFLIWVQTPTKTKMVNLHYDYRNRFKVGDSCLLIIEKYKENE